MKMTMVLDSASRAKLRQAPLTLQAGMAQIAQDGQKDAYQLAIAGAQIGIYATVAGKYVRTKTYLQSITAVGIVNSTGVEVRVGDSAPYSSFLEYGSLGQPLPAAAAEQLATALGTTPAALSLGRTGRAFTLPNPAITRAAVFAGLRMVNNLEGLIRFATR